MKGADPRAMIPRYYWDTGKGLRAVPVAPPAAAAIPPPYVYPQATSPAQTAYFWDGPMPSAGRGAAAYNWAGAGPGPRAAHNYPDFPAGGAAYNYDAPGAAAAYNYEPPPAAYNYETGAAYNYEAPGGTAAYNYEGPAGA